MKRYIKAAIVPLFDEPLDVLREIASNPDTPVETLVSLYDQFNQDSGNYEYFIMLDLASNPSTPVDILEHFCNHRINHSIRNAVASNPSTTLPLLEKLYKGSSYDVRRYIADNPNVSVELLRKMSESEPDITEDYYGMCSAIAANEKTPSDILEKLSTSRNGYVRAYVAENPNTSLDVLRRMLINDKNYWVQYYITKNPNYDLIMGE